MINGASGLVEYGVLGIMALIFMGVIVYLQKQNTKQTELIMAGKEKEVDYWRETANRHDRQIDEVLSQLSANTTRLLDLYERQEKTLEKIPDEVVTRIKLSKA